MNEQETIADIIAEMRGGPIPQHRHDRVLLRHFADRLEAAYKREKAAIEADALSAGGLVEAMRQKKATAEKSSAVGDCAKLPKTVDTRFDICQNIAMVLKIGRDYQNKDGYRGAHYDTVKLLCDAIEYQQEQLKTEAGDAAKLREALEYMFILIDGRNLVLECETTEEISGVQGKLAEARAALSAPPRNCDRFASAEDAWDAYDEWVESYRSKGKTEPFNEFGWLFAHATEKEGGAK